MSLPLRECSCSSDVGCVYCEVDGQPIPGDHWLIAAIADPRRSPEKEIAAELRQAMAKRGWTNRALAAESGLAVSSISNMRCGQYTPKQATIIHLAAILRWPRLSALWVDLYRRQCETCQASYSGRGRWCSERCKHTANQRRDAMRERSSSFQAERRARRRLRAYQAAVEAFCRACEPDLTCKRSTCPLRPVSPLPLAALAAEQLAAEQLNARPSGSPPRVPPAQPRRAALTRPLGEVLTKPWHDRWW